MFMLAMGGGAFIGGPAGLEAGAGVGGPKVSAGDSLEAGAGTPGMAARKSSANWSKGLGPSIFRPIKIRI